MLLTMAKWESIRERFTEEEKAKINAAIIGETICPKGCILDEDKLGAQLLKQIRS